MADIEGYAELTATFEQMRDQVGGKNLRSAVMAATLPALRAIQAAAPVGTRGHYTYKHRFVTPGFLKRSIRRKSLVSRDGTTASVIIGAMPEAFYAQFFEFGTSKIPRRPFLVPSFKSQQNPMGDRFAGRMKEILDAIARANS